MEKKVIEAFLSNTKQNWFKVIDAFVQIKILKRCFGKINKGKYLQHIWQPTGPIS